MFRRDRRLVLLAALPVALLLVLRPAAAVEAGPASAFIEKLGNEAIQALTKPGIDKATREQAFRRLLNDTFAVKGIGRFVLGRHWRGTDEQQQRRYLAAFENLIVATYAARFEQYDGQSFTVGAERADGEDGRIVDSQIAGREGKPVKLQWRLRQSPEGLKIVDIMVEGVSMAITQRSEFAAVMQQKNGSIDGLIEELEAKVKRMR